MEEVVIIVGCLGIMVGVVSNWIFFFEIYCVVGSLFVILLEWISGVSFFSIGIIVFKFVIYGMYGNCILIINNGVC